MTSPRKRDACRTLATEAALQRAVATGEPMLSPKITRRLIGHVTDSEGGERGRHTHEQLDRLIAERLPER